MEMHFIMCLSKPRLSYNGKGQAVWGTQCPATLGWLWWLKRRLLRAGGLAGLPKRAALRQDGAAALCSPVMAQALLLLLSGSFVTAPYPEGPPPLPSVPEGALLARVLLGCPPKGHCLPPLPAGLEHWAASSSSSISHLSPDTSVGVMLTPHWLMIFGSQG